MPKKEVYIPLVAGRTLDFDILVEEGDTCLLYTSEDQIRRTKTRLTRKNKESLAEAFLDHELFNDEDVDDDEVVRTKSIVPKEMSLDAVSYTHLDVYKRQASSCVIRVKK